MLSKIYDEHAKQARQHEDQRERMTNMILAVSGILITFISFNGLNHDALVASVGMIILGGYGCIFSLKHYERNRFHTGIMKAFRTELDKEMMLPASGTSRSPKSSTDIRRDGKTAHENSMRRLSQIKDEELRKKEAEKRDKRKREEREKPWIVRQRLYMLWAGLPILIALFGFLLSVLIIVKW